MLFLLFTNTFAKQIQEPDIDLESSDFFPTFTFISFLLSFAG